MATEVLLDTSPIIACLRGKVSLKEIVPDEALLFTSLFTYGELMKGVRKASFPTSELTKVEGFLAGLAILMPDSGTAIAYATIAADLEKRGERIPENDVWIAAVAIECELTLVTGDAHFERVHGLNLRRYVL